MQLSYTWVLANKKKNLTSKENAALKKKKKNGVIQKHLSWVYKNIFFSEQYLFLMK